MTRGRRSSVAAGVLLAPLVLVTGQGTASAELAVYNGAVSATAVHVQVGTSAFPNFATGAVDNRWPLAAVHQDSSPFNQAYSSPLDTGPAGQTAAGTAQQSQPQYAEMRCPPRCDEKPVVVGSEPGPFASAQATETEVVAAARTAGEHRSGTDGFPALDPGKAAALRAGLSAWRTRFLTLDDARRHPMPAADAPDGFEGDTARSRSRLHGGALVLTGDSAVGWISLGGGAVTLSDVSVHVEVTNDGTPRRDVNVRIGAAEVGGTPVTIGPDGVSVKGQALPGLAGHAEQATAALNQVLGQAGIELRALAPAEQASEHQLTLDAVGMLVRIAPPSAAGFPAQFITIAVGEVFADSLAVPGHVGGEPGDGISRSGGGMVTTEPLPVREAGATGSSGSSVDQGSRTDLTPDASIAGPEAGAGGRPAPPGTAPVAGDSPLVPSPVNTAPEPPRLDETAARAGRGAPDKPAGLLLLYFLWQSLVIGTVASLWLWRRGAFR